MTDERRVYTTEEAEELLIAIREGVPCSMCVRADEDMTNETCSQCLSQSCGRPNFELYKED